MERKNEDIYHHWSAAPYPHFSIAAPVIVVAHAQSQYKRHHAQRDCRKQRQAAAAQTAAPYQHDDPIGGSFCVTVVTNRHDDKPGPSSPRLGLDGETTPERHGRTEEVLFGTELSAEVEVGARAERQAGSTEAS